MATDMPPVTAEDIADLVVSIYDTATALRRLGDMEAAIEGQTQARWQVMNVASDGTWTVPQIARRLGVQRQSVQRIVDRLSAEDVVRLAPNPDHATSPIVQLTDEGARTLRSINEVADRWHRSVAASTDPAALHTISEFLSWLRASATDAERRLETPD